MKKLTLLIIIGYCSAVNNLMTMEPVISSKNDEQEAMVTIVTSDEKEIEIPLSVAKKIPTINTLFEDIGQAEGAMIPLPTINSREFKTVRTLFPSENLSKFLDDPVTINELVDIKSMSNTDLIALLNALDFLNLEQFVDKFLKDLSERQLSKQDWDLLNRNLIQQLWPTSSIYKWLIKKVLLTVPVGLYVRYQNDKEAIVSPNHKFFAVLDYQSFTIFDIDKGLTQLGEPLEHENLTGLVFSLDNHYIASWSQNDETVKLWIIENNEINQVGNAMNHENVYYVTFNGNPTTGLSSWSNLWQKTWDLNTHFIEGRGGGRHYFGIQLLKVTLPHGAPQMSRYSHTNKSTNQLLLQQIINLTPNQIQLLVTLYYSQITTMQWLLNKIRSLALPVNLQQTYLTFSPEMREFLKQLTPQYRNAFMRAEGH